MARYEQIGDFAATIADPSANLIRFGRPEITVETVSIEGYDVPGVTALHVRLTVTDLDDADLQLTIGHADLLSLEVSRVSDYRQALELLTTGSHWDDMAPWGFHGLFNPKDNDDCLFRRYPKDHLQVVTIVRDVFVDPSFRRHQFGAWMLAEIAGRPHELTTLFVGEPRAEDPYVEEDAYWKDVLKATQLNWRYQIAMAGSPGLKTARDFLSQSLLEPIYVSSAEIRDRYDAGDSTLWPRSLVMPALSFDHREAEYRRLWDEYIHQSPNRERHEEIKERLDEIREEKDEEYKDWQRRLDAKLEIPDVDDHDDDDDSDDSDDDDSGPSVAVPAASRMRNSPASNGCRSSTSTRSKPSKPPSWPPLPTATTYPPASRWSCSVTAAPAKRICSSAWDWRPASKAARSATPPALSWSMNSSRPPMSGSCHG